MNNWLFRALASELNPDVEVMSDYIDSKTKIHIKCKICGEEYDTSHSNILHGKLHNSNKHSKWCSTWIHNAPKRKSIEKKLRYLNGFIKDIDVISYNPQDTSITFRCQRCGNIYSESIFYIDRPHCDKCKNLNTRTDNSGYNAHLRSLIENSCNIHLCEKNKSVLSCHCSKCNSDFDINGYMKRRKITCPVCTRRTRSEQKAAQRFAQANSKYTSIRRKCDYLEYCVRNNDYLCKKCLMLSDKYYTKHEFKEISENANRNISILGNYVNSTTKIKYKCKTCGSIYEAKPYSLINGSCRCKKCQCSSGERKVANFLDDNNIQYQREYIFQGCFDKKPLRFDFYIPSMNIAIEYDGIQHFEPIDFFNTKNNDTLDDIHRRDKIKNDFCLKNGITLIRVPYNCKNINDFLRNHIDVTITN